MLNKQAIDASYYAPSVKELQYANNNSKGVANALLAALGISAAGYSAKRLIEGLAASRLSDEIKPDVTVQKLLRDKTDTIDNAFLYSKLKEKAKEEEIEDLVADAIETKTALYKAAGIPINIDLSLFGKSSRRKGLDQSFFENVFANKQNSKFVDALKKVDVGKVLTHKDPTLSSGLHYDPSTLKTDSLWTKYVSAPLAKMGPQSAIPLGIALGGGLVAAPMLAKALVGKVDDALPKQKREAKFVDTAKKIYEDAAKELQNAGYKKEKDDRKRDKEASFFKGRKPPKDIVKSTRAGGNPLTSAANLPTLAAAALLAYATYKGVKGFDKGMDKAKNDLSHGTQFLRGWKATNKLRDYDYNPLAIELADEPGLKEKLKDVDDARIKALLSDLKESDGIEFNPIEVQRLTSDYEELA